MQLVNKTDRRLGYRSGTAVRLQCPWRKRASALTQNRVKILRLACSLIPPHAAEFLKRYLLDNVGQRDDPRFANRGVANRGVSLGRGVAVAPFDFSRGGRDGNTFSGECGLMRQTLTHVNGWEGRPFGAVTGGWRRRAWATCTRRRRPRCTHGSWASDHDIAMHFSGSHCKVTLRLRTFFPGVITALSMHAFTGIELQGRTAEKY